MLAKHFGALTNPAMYGPLIAGFTIGGFGLSIPFWYKAGKYYKEFMVNKDLEEKSKFSDPVI